MLVLGTYLSGLLLGILPLMGEAFLLNLIIDDFLRELLLLL
jgi:hypothetical protein